VNKDLTEQKNFDCIKFTALGNYYIVF